jgi:hypothetical protein
MPYVFQVLLGQPVTIAYEEIPPFIAAASENQTTLKFPVHTSSIMQEMNLQYSPRQIEYLMQSWRCGFGRNAYLLLLVIFIPPVALQSGLKQVCLRSRQQARRMNNFWGGFLKPVANLT